VTWGEDIFGRRSWLGLPLALIACTPSPLENVDDPRDLSPYENAFDESDPQWSPQPVRAKPYALVVGSEGTKAWVALQGSPDSAGTQVVSVDLERHEVSARIQVGHGPSGLALHPDGEVVVAVNRYSNYLSVIDAQADVRVHSPGVDFYARDVAFSPDGDRMYVSNRWHDAVSIYEVERREAGIEITTRDEPGISTGANPTELAVSPDGRLLSVASVTELAISVIDTADRDEMYRIDVGGPPNGMAFVDDYLFVATTSASTHHWADAGPDTDGDGNPGDGTPNINFQDLQNEIAVYRLSDGAEQVRYTSDTICCKDYRDVDPQHELVGGPLLPPADTWIVGGALPEQIAYDPTTADIWVTYSASNQVGHFAVDPAAGTLTAKSTWATEGHNPRGIALADGRVAVLHRLSDSLGLYETDGTLVANIDLGQGDESPFPATDAEIGELFNSVTAPFTVDGDQSCTHCHREGGNLAKAFSMPLTRYPGLGMRMTMAYRGAADTRPWFFESAMDETNFIPVMNEFARIENFCCSDYTLWPNGAPAGCTSSPPPECMEQPNPTSSDGVDPSRDVELEPFMHPRPTASASRDAFYLEAAQEVIGRSKSFGDGVFFEDPIDGTRLPVSLDFDGITRALGVFLLANTALPPNPNRPDSPAALRGQALFESPATGCSACHPAPSFAVSTDVNPLDIPVVMGPVVTPVRADDGTNLDLFAEGFLAAFPRAEQETCEEVCGEQACEADPTVCDDIRNVRFGVPSLRGIWDRAPMFLHDGRARSLREVLCTPGHPALEQDETGFNERDGVPDTHGATSHLTPTQVDDLVSYMLTL
jgi:hypothetical protein